MTSWSLLKLAAAILPVLHLLGAFAASEVLLYARSPQGAIAWCLFLVVFPYFGLPVYMIFGRSKFKGYKERIARVVEHQNRDLAWYRQQLLGSTKMPEDPDPARRDAFSKIANAEFLGGNEVTLLVDGQATFDAIFAEVDRAASFILIEFFIIKEDELGLELQRRLVAAAQRGVSVRVLYDEVGTHRLSRKFLGTFADAGIEVRSFGTRRGGLRNFFQINFRNHRKIVVVDGQVGFIGGHNVGDEYVGRSAEFGHWRDTHIRVSGPAVLHLKRIFFADWVWATGAPPNISLSPPVPAGDITMLTLAFGPASDLDACALFFLHAISSARSRVWIATPYFIPDDALLCALQLAAMRGVDVRVLVPAKRDHMLVWLASFFFVPAAAATGVKAYRYTDGFLHQKVLVLDDLYAAVGSANFDNRSFRLNFEATSLVADRGFNQQVAEMLERDMASATDVSNERMSDFPLWKRLGSRFARLFSPIL